MVLHTSTPSFQSDVKTIAALKAINPNLRAGLIGAKVAVNADFSLRDAPMVDFVARNESDFTIKEVADDLPWGQIAGLKLSQNDGVIVHNEDQRSLRTWIHCRS